MNIKVSYSNHYLALIPNNFLQSLNPLNNKIIAIAAVAFACLAAGLVYFFLYRKDTNKAPASLNTQNASGTDDTKNLAAADAVEQKQQTHTTSEIIEISPSTQKAVQNIVAEMNLDPAKPLAMSVDQLLTIAKSQGDIIKSLNLSEIEISNEQLVELVSHCPHLISLSIKSTTINQETLSKMNLNFLEALDLSDCVNVTNSDLVFLEELTQLQVLRLKNCTKITGVVYFLFRNLTALRVLDLGGCPFLGSRNHSELFEFDSYKKMLLKGLPTGHYDNLIPKLPALQEINLENCPWVDGMVLTALGNLANLRVLNLSGCKNFSHDHLEHLKTCGLKVLHLRGCKQIEYKHVIAIGHLSSLEELDLSYCDSVTDVDLFNLADLENLRILRLRGLSYVEGNFLSKLWHRAKLETLDVSNCYKIKQMSKDEMSRIFNNTPYNFFEYLKECTALRELNLSGYHKMNDEFLEYVLNLSKLQVLNLDHCSMITDDGLKQLKPLISLKSLNVSDTQITNNGLAHLSGLVDLEILVLQLCTKISNNGLKHLAPLSKLRTLNVIGCPSITPAGLKQLNGTVKVIGA